MELLSGRPAHDADRTQREIKVYNFLDNLNITYHRIDHAPAMTMEACAHIDEALQATMCKNLLLCDRQCTHFYLLLLPGDKQFKTSILSKQIGSSRLSFASGEHMEALLDITPGSLSVLGLINDSENRVRLLIDEALLSGEYIGVHPNVNTSSLRIRTRDLLDIIIPATHHEITFVALP